MEKFKEDFREEEKKSNNIIKILIGWIISVTVLIGLGILLLPSTIQTASETFGGFQTSTYSYSLTESAFGQLYEDGDIFVDNGENWSVTSLKFNNDHTVDEGWSNWFPKTSIKNKATWVLNNNIVTVKIPHRGYEKIAKFRWNNSTGKLTSFHSTRRLKIIKNIDEERDGAIFINNKTYWVLDNNEKNKWGAGEVTQNGVNLRRGPGTNYAKLGYNYTTEQDFYIVGMTDDWFQICELFEGGNVSMPVWIHKDFVKILKGAKLIKTTKYQN